MSLMINQNITALNAWRNLGKTDREMSGVMEKLSSGLRINRAADDPAGLVISEQMRAQIVGLKAAVKNSEKGISMIQTAEAALDKMHALLDKIRSLALDSANTATNDSTMLEANQAEVDNILETITRIAAHTQYGTKTLLDGKNAYGYVTSGALVTAASDASNALNGTYTVTIASTSAGYTAFLTFDDAGAASATSAATAVAVEAGGTYTLVDASGNKLSVTLADTLSAGSQTVAVDTSNGLEFQVGANENQTVKVEIVGVSANSLGLFGLDIKTDPQGSIDKIDKAINTVSRLRGKLGAFQANTLEANLDNLRVAAENLQASDSVIRDADMASEMADFTKFQVMMQAGTAMLAQANQIPQTLLQLLKG